VNERCRVCDDLEIEYLLSIETVKSARQEAAFSVTPLQLECAKVRLSRVEGHMEHTRRKLVSHLTVCRHQPPQSS